MITYDSLFYKNMKKGTSCAWTANDRHTVSFPCFLDSDDAHVCQDHNGSSSNPVTPPSLANTTPFLLLPYRYYYE